MVTIGVFVRADLSQELEVVQRLDALEGVRTFELASEGAIGLVFTAVDIDAAHARLTREIEAVEGVLGAWPVHTCLDEPTPESSPFSPQGAPVRGPTESDQR